MKYRLLSIADAELAEAAKWYQEQAPGLGEEYLDEFEAVMDRIMSFPDAWARIGARYRRCLFRRFPYAVLYSHTGDEICVAGVVDLRRDPQHTEQRIRKT